VVRLLLLLGHEGPLEPRGEAGAAPPAQPRFLHAVDDPGGLHCEGLGEHLVAAPFHPALVRTGVSVSEMLGEDDRLPTLRLGRVAHQTIPKAERGTRNAEQRVPTSAFRLPRSVLTCTFSRSPEPGRASRSRGSRC